MATRKLTKQQTLIQQHLNDRDDFGSAQAIHAELRSTGTEIGLATVYRGLQVLAAEGLVDVLRTDEGEALYRACSFGHHHHLVCRECGRAVEVEFSAMERWAAKLAEEHGYTDITHSAEVFGICRECSTA